jgi:beta-galactosidase
MRGLKQKNFWVMEQQAGPGGWEILSVVPRPGELRLWAYQSIAHGADAIVFFRWRTARFGTEEYWHGLLDHDATPGRRYEEIKSMGAEIKKMGEQIAGSIVKSPVAMVLSYNARFAFQIQPNNPGFNYSEHFYQIYLSFYRQHISVDVVAPDADLSSYKLVIAPALHIVTTAIAENLKRYVQAGGVLVVTQRTGVKDETNAIVNQRLPGLLAEMCGVEIEEYDSLSSSMQNRIEFVIPELAGNAQPTVGVLCDILKPTGATVVARYLRDYYAGKPAITHHQFGKGQAVYIGAVGDEQLYDALAGWLLGMSSVQPVFAVQDGLEVTERWQGDRRLLFILNHTEHAQAVELDRRYTCLLGKQVSCEGKFSIASRDVLVLQES